MRQINCMTIVRSCQFLPTLSYKLRYPKTAKVTANRIFITPWRGQKYKASEPTVT